MPFEQTIADVDGLRRYFAEPHPNVRAKAIDHIDGGARDFLALATFVVVATQGPRGGDASPRGGPPGFAAVLDERRLAIGDLAGNRRLDSFENIVANPRVGLLFLIPGMSETLRINGRASLTTDPAVLDACRCEGVDPKVALGVDVDEVYLHCAKAFRRSGLWEPDTWPAPEDRPRASAIWSGHVNLGDVPLDLIDEDLERGYAASMWQPGGDDGA
jgi:PPOX class probable FMN-dependent enzyme